MSYDFITKLDEVEIIAGNDFTLDFEIVDENDVPVVLDGSNCKWTLAPLGMPDSTVITKSGVVYGSNRNMFTIQLKSIDTKDLYGKYLQQPVIFDIKGKEFRRAEGIIYLKHQNVILK